ncbi:SLD2 [Candida theae]|uniref:DNA replication regulator SLD2 n=1 Tax=Candida theae TaxID=1198502 RepID=A0AAD5FVZ1_9ASCO|nr:SLD2 [Candida theae]KAI5948849.1 SLD2 [Candida theae]
MSEDILKVKQEIKDWEHAFQSKHGRLPSRSDVRNNPKIKALYSKYRSCKSNKQAPATKEKLTVQEDVDDNENVLPTPNGELGPTPQANGRVLSIFDVKLTPPESSPLRSKSAHVPDVLSSFDGASPETTPVKAKRRLSFSTPTKTSTGATPTTVTKTLQQTVETPRYLKSNVTTPTFRKNAIDFSISPSPLKPNRLRRKLMDVYNMSIMEIEEEEEEAAVEHFEDAKGMEDVEVVTAESNPPAKRKTQKRQTRRSKMAPRPVAEVSSLGEVDVQQRMIDLEEKERTALTTYMNSDSESEPETLANDQVHGSPVKKTRKPIAQNYKRLKINDPRSRRFKQRMRR